MEKMWVGAKSLVVFNRKVLMLQRSNYVDLGKGEWDIPGGGMQFDEDLPDCLHREVGEETGLAVRVDRLLYAVAKLVNPTVQVVILVYLSHANSDKVTLSREHTDYLWATKQQLRELLTKPTLHDYEKNSVFDLPDFD